MEADKRADPKPSDEEVDVFGLTHGGRVRHENQDQFLICSLHKQMRIHGASLPLDQLPVRSDRLAFLGLVADGVGGQAAGEEASRLTIAEVANYVTHTMQCYYTSDPHHEELFLKQLHESIMDCHELLRKKAEQDSHEAGMATTLTLVMSIWPRAYIVHVGDSRCYRLRDGALEQITKDQTLAQHMVDMGVLNDDQARESQWSHVLSGAIGGAAATPVTQKTDVRWGDTILLCSDGLTKHVTDAEIRDHLLQIDSARSACEALRDVALERGGTDNITIVMGRLPGSPSTRPE